MTPEEWLDKNTGYCKPMAARITVEQCKNNQRDELRCKKCEGLDMEKKFKNHATCSVAGCEKQAWKGGMCYKHFHQVAKLSQTEPNASQTNPGIQNQDALEELAENLPAEVPVPAPDPNPEAPAGLFSLLPVVEDHKPGYFLDFSERRIEYNILTKNGVTSEQIVQTLCLIASGGYVLRKETR